MLVGLHDVTACLDVPQVSWVESLTELQGLEADLNSGERRRANPEPLRRKVLPVLKAAIERVSSRQGIAMMPQWAVSVKQ
jgi:hypothetical protein